MGPRDSCLTEAGSVPVQCSVHLCGLPSSSLESPASWDFLFSVLFSFFLKVVLIQMLDVDFTDFCPFEKIH